nr:MAG TPA: hypothetical protein [Caudoviricetes sp.]
MKPPLQRMFPCIECALAKKKLFFTETQAKQFKKVFSIGRGKKQAKQRGKVFSDGRY